MKHSSPSPSRIRIRVTYFKIHCVLFLQLHWYLRIFRIVSSCHWIFFSWNVSEVLNLLYDRVRFHYGHPDVFDRLFHLTTGGVSKASKSINLSEDIFAGSTQSVICL